MGDRLVPVFLLSHPFSGDNILRSGFSYTENFVDLGKADQNVSVDQIRHSIDQRDSASIDFAIVSGSYDWFWTNKISNWIIENQYPVIHLIRENTLDCLVAELANQKEVLEMKTETVIYQISQMRAATNKIREELAHANSIEVQFNNLRTPTGCVSGPVMRRICGWLGMDTSSVEFSTNRLFQDPSRRAIDEIKMKFRPDMMRFGFGNLYDLPRAA